MEESTLDQAERESAEHLGETENQVSEPSISRIEKEEGNATTKTETFGFPILDISRNISMKNIPLSSLPTFIGMSTEDLDLFLFEFDILCRSYNYSDDAQKLNLFPAKIKDSALRWFMSLGENTILSWDQMKDTFLRKYQDYGKDNAKNNIFKMQQTEYESPEDYLERFLYNYQKSKLFTTDPAVVIIVFLKGLRDDFIEFLNLLSSGDVHQNHFSEIPDYCRRYSRGQAKIGKGQRDPFRRNTKQSSGNVTRTELGNLLENFKTDILSTINNQLDNLKLKKKQEEEVSLAIFYHRCQNKHSEKEYPLNAIEICGLCTLEHPTSECPTLLELQAMYRGGGVSQEQPYPSRRPWRAQNPNTFYDPNAQYQQQQWDPSPVTYPQWTPQQTQPWKQGWRGPMYGNPSYHTYPQYPANISQLRPIFNPPQMQSLLPPPIQRQITTPLNPNQQQQPPINANQQQNQATHNPPKPIIIPAQPIPNPNN
jgi:hypothetical protein